MTRINVGVSPRKLTDQHLLAEHREIVRICALYKKQKEISNIPEKFCLGTGHVRFFLNKGYYTHLRYQLLFMECKRRGFNVTNYEKSWRVFKREHYASFGAKLEYRNLIVQRVTKRIKESNQQPRYYGENISKQQAIKLLTT